VLTNDHDANGSTGLVLTRTAGAGGRSADAPAVLRHAQLLDSGKAGCGAMPSDTSRIPLGTVGAEATGALQRVRVSGARREGRVTLWLGQAPEDCQPLWLPPWQRVRPRPSSGSPEHGRSAWPTALAGACAWTCASSIEPDRGSGVQPVAPLRVLETHRAGSTPRIKLVKRRGVKCSDRRLVLNVSATRPRRSGAVSVYPAAPGHGHARRCA